MENVNAVTISTSAWENVQDHSKWAVCKTNEWVCIGDMNRADS